MNLKLIFFVILIQSLNIVSSKRFIFKHVVVLFRHGARAPIVIYPNNPNNETYWNKYGGLSQITSKGIIKSIEYGRFIRKRYESFLARSYNRNKFYIRSTDIDRTLISAEAFLAGLYSPNNFVPVHTAIAPTDPIFNYDAPCPLLVKLREETKQTKEYLKVLEENKIFIENLKHLSGLNFTLNDIWKLAENLISDKTEGLKQPKWAEDSYKRLVELNDYTYFVDYGSLNKSRLISGPLLNEIRKNIQKVAVENSSLEMSVYANHDNYLAGINILLNLTWPPYQFPFTGSIIFELKQDIYTKQYFVLVFIKKNLYTEPISLKQVKIQGCDYMCPVEKFMELTNDKILFNSFNNECQL